MSRPEPSWYPSDLKIIAKTPSSVTFQWSKLKCYQENGPIIGYHYRIYHDPFHYTEGTVNQYTTTYTVHDTEITSFSVAAVNEDGIGQHCPPLEVALFESGSDFNARVSYTVV